MKKEDVKVGSTYLISNGKNEMRATVVRAGDSGFIVKTASGKNMPITNPDRFLELVEEAPAKTAETAPVAKKEATPAKAQKKVSKAVKFLPEKEEITEKQEKEEQEEAPVKKSEKKVKALKEEKAPRKKREGKSMAEAAIEVMTGNEKGMTIAQILKEMEDSGLWVSSTGKTPANTLNAIINRDINTGDEPRFVKVSRGVYKLA